MSAERPTMKKLKIAIAGILLVLVLVLVIQNQEPVATEVLLWTVEAPHFALVASVFLGGIIAGYVLGRTTRIELGTRKEPPRPGGRSSPRTGGDAGPGGGDAPSSGRDAPPSS